jgi:hypothetical protein
MSDGDLGSGRMQLGEGTKSFNTTLCKQLAIFECVRFFFKLVPSMSTLYPV